MQIFPKHPSAPDTYYIGGGWSPACITAVDKRFTDAELAAEYWAATMGNLWDADRGNEADLAIGREVAATIHRMITNPAHDENPA